MSNGAALLCVTKTLLLDEESEVDKFRRASTDFGTTRGPGVSVIILAILNNRNERIISGLWDTPPCCFLLSFPRFVVCYTENFGKFNVLNDEIIERIISTSNQDANDLEEGTETPILHGVGGRVIKAKTLNQKRLVESMRNPTRIC